MGTWVISQIAQAQSCTVERASVSSSGAESDNQGDYSTLGSCLSADGRFIAFRSRATNLVAIDTNGKADVFVHDRVSGVTMRASVDSSGVEADDSSGFPSISGDGRHLAFTSSATNLVPGDTNGFSDVFVHDRLTGQTTRVSVSSSGAQANADAQSASISADGRFVAFEARSTNLGTSGSPNYGNVFVHDRPTGQTQLVSVGPSNQWGNAESKNASISADGRFVAFQSLANNLTASGTAGNSDIFVRDRLLSQTLLASRGTAGNGGNGNSQNPAISGDGRFVTFDSDASDLIPLDTNNARDVFMHDLASGRTLRASVSASGAQASGLSNLPAIAADGRTIAFGSQASDLVAGDTNGLLDIFVRDLATGTTERVSVDASGAESNSLCWYASISADGRSIAFDCWADNLISNDTNDAADAIVHECVPAPWMPYCFGELGACPCGNDGALFKGCENSFITGGGVLWCEGVASVSADTLVLRASGLAPSTPAVFLQGTDPVAGGAGASFGDGLSCVGGTTVVLGTKPALNGAVELGSGVGSDPLISIAGFVPTAGGVRRYQIAYRNPQPWCTSSTFNLTNGVEVLWSP